MPPCPLKNLYPIAPAMFFQVKAKIYREEDRCSFPLDATALLDEERWVDLSLSWSEKGVQVDADVNKKIDKKDCLELFIDTRDLKSTNSITRFCHHFLIYPDKFGEEQVVEVTHFRYGDSHEFADSSLFFVDTDVKRDCYEMKVFIPKEVLHGYDPAEFRRLGFCYRFVRSNGLPQHFPLSSNFVSIEKHPELWASLELEEKK